jgi:putative DNA methylase
MIPKECKRLAEVDFPIAVVSRHSAREKSIRHGHPSTLHLWWARRPLAACRAMLMALLLPDPCDNNCPKEFISSARDILLKKQGCPKRWVTEIKTPEGLRKILLEFIGDFANWDNSANPDYLETARALVKAAYPEETPLVVDPFAGGGSIPLEALRLGCETFASDLNPVSCLILKVMLEYIPRYGMNLADELRHVGDEIRDQAEKETIEFYPKDSDGATPVAYIWSRTIKCEAPNCGAEIPLTRSFWLCKKATRKIALKHKIINTKNKSPEVVFEIFEPKTEKEVHSGTVSRAKAKCLCCGTVLSPERVRAQLSEQRGGANVKFDDKAKRIGGARILAVVTLKPGETGHCYRLSSEQDYKAIYKAMIHVNKIRQKWEQESNDKKSISPIPNEQRPISAADRVRPYGMLLFSDLTTVRQQLALNFVASKIQSIKSEQLKIALSMALGRCVDYWSSGAVWASGGEFVAHTFGLQVIPIGWDFPEAAPWADSSGNFAGAIDWVARVIEKSSVIILPGQVQLADACLPVLPMDTAGIWFTDPPYYDAVRYSDLSDTFFVWLRRALPNHALLRDPYDLTNLLTPKDQEIVQDEVKITKDGQVKNRNFFENKMAIAFHVGRTLLQGDGIASVVFAHKTTEGWEALLSGVIRGGWTITCSWPIATERPGRLRSQESAALATSVHLVCRPRAEDAPVGDWGEVLRELPKRVGDWMERLQGEGIRGADLVFACIGPALEIYSRYSKVEMADGHEVKLGEYLKKIWEVVGRSALEQVLGTEESKARNGMAGVLEEDARLTALFLWTLQSTNGNGEGKSKKKKGKKEEVEEEEEIEEEEDEEDTPKKKVKGYSLVFDVVRRFAQPLGIDLPRWEDRVIETKKGVVRLLSVSERAKQLFGEDGTDVAAEWISEDPSKSIQLRLFPETQAEQVPKIRGRKRGRAKYDISGEAAAQIGVTTLDRVHAAMLLQAGGKANALRELIKAEQERGSDFLRLANALSALYPTGSEEKRLLDAMLLAVRR